LGKYVAGVFLPAVTGRVVVIAAQRGLRGS
jgi:hypothetical protein